MENAIRVEKAHPSGLEKYTLSAHLFEVVQRNP